MPTRTTNFPAGLLFAAIAPLLMAGCDGQARGFSLPAGDAERGRVEFAGLGCVDCHHVVGAETFGAASQADQNKAIDVALGGRVTRVKTYGDLVTSIINPSHKLTPKGPDTTNPDGSSRMRGYNDVMTVQQLIDLVTFLESHYAVYVPQTHYPTYP